MNGTVTRIIDSEFKTGYSEKTKKNWTIMKVEVKLPDSSLVEATTFDMVADGDEVELEQKEYTSPTTGKTYQNYQAKVPRKNFGPKTNVESNDEVMKAMRLLFAEVKTIHRKMDEFMGNDPSIKTEPEEDIAQKQAARDWTSLKKNQAEPLPEYPGEIDDNEPDYNNYGGQ